MIEQSEPVGHAVRAVYMYSGMADVAAVTGDQAMRAAGKRIWDYLVTSKLYLTGGIGASGSGEAFGQPYELPNMTAYNETCASVGMDFWNHRLFLLEGDAKYIDVMERTLFNGLLSGVSLDGKTFFYPNPLESNGQHARQEWFGVACCPGNITRFMPSVPGYLYATKGDSVYVNLFAKGTANIDLPGGAITIDQDTRYPWDGAVKMIVKPKQARRFAINVRIPGWARKEPVPSALYRFIDNAGAGPTVTVNGDLIPGPSLSPTTIGSNKGYVTIDRTWSPGDTIALNLPMPVRRIVSNDQVIANRNRVALQRGPIVYAAEWPDNPNGKVRNIVLPDRNPLTTEFRGDLLNGVQVIKGHATGLAYDAKGGLIRSRSAVHGDPVCDVGESRPRPDGGVAGARRCGRAADALPDRRHHRDHRRVEAAEWPRQESPQHHRRRGAGELIGLVRLLRLVAGAGQQAGVGRADVREAVDRARKRDLLVRRHRQGRRARARVVAAALQVRQRLAAGADDERLRCRAQRLEPDRVHARHHGRPPHRALDAAGILRRTARMRVK